MRGSWLATVLLFAMLGATTAGESGESFHNTKANMVTRLQGNEYAANIAGPRLDPANLDSKRGKAAFAALILALHASCGSGNCILAAGQ